MGMTMVSPRDLNLRLLFSVKDILLARGYEVIEEGNSEKLLIAEENNELEIYDTLFDIFNDQNSRRELKKIFYSEIKEVIQEKNQQLINHRKFVKERARFDNTLEWFAGELMIKKFAAFSASHGVIIKDIIRNSTETEAGDYDALIVLRNTNVAYFECKAGSFDGESIMKCYERMLSINCEYSIMICIEEIKEDKLIWDSEQVRVPVTAMHYVKKVHIKNNPETLIYEINNCYIIDMYGDLEKKIKTILRINSAKINYLHFVMGPGEEDLASVGYTVETIHEKRYDS